MKVFRFLSFGIVLFICTTTFANSAAIKESFLEACDASPHVDEGSDCTCVFNEVIHQFGEDDAKELIPFINGDQSPDSEVLDALSFISGKCED